jgi:hypothetical protein
MQNKSTKAFSGWSKSELAAEFSIDRRKVRELLAYVQSLDETNRGHPTYRLSDVSLILGAYKAGIDLEAASSEGKPVDPDKLRPKVAKDYWDAQRSKHAHKTEIAALIPDKVVSAAFSSAFNRLIAFIATIPDAFERDTDMTPEQIGKAKKLTDQLSRDLHNLADDFK